MPAMIETALTRLKLPATAAKFSDRVRRHGPRLLAELQSVYGDRPDMQAFVDAILEMAYANWKDRPADLRALDDAREADSEWFASEKMIGGMCYVDLYAGNLKGLRERIPYLKSLGLTYLHLMPLFKCPEPESDGGYAVSSYREVNPKLGNIDDLRALAQALREAGISLTIDFIFNHTSDEHDWALAAKAGDEKYKNFYLIFPDRTQPDAYERTTREIFPDEHPGAFSQLEDGRWVWTTFHRYQWDLNYANPDVFVAMAGEMLAIANLGAEVLRMDAVAFIWKRLGTNCENLPEAHTLIRAFNAVTRIAAPSLLFKSEAIVHPDDVVKYISPEECQISYNPLQMALLWNTIATRDARLLQLALEERQALPEGTAWVNYVRSHDDIGWTFSDEDAARLGIHGHTHREFLNRFFVGRAPNSFARGVPFQENPVTGDCRVSGTTASLVGLEQNDPHALARVLLLYGMVLAGGGMPLIYLGDELGVVNDRGFANDPAKAEDSRWVHRVAVSDAMRARRDKAGSPAHALTLGLRRLIDTRTSEPVFAGNRLHAFWTGQMSVLGFLRESAKAPGVQALVLGNFSESPQTVAASVFSGLPSVGRDLLSELPVYVHEGLALAPYEQRWILFRR